MNAERDSQPDRAEEFMAIYTRHHQRIYRYIVTLCPALDVAEDILSETSLVLWRKYDEFEPGTNFFGWACQIVRNLVMQRYRQDQRTPRLLDDDVLKRVATIAADDETSPAAVDLNAVLSHCLGRLKGGDRELIEARYYQNKPVKSLAAARGRSANALGKSLARIRAALLECIRRRKAEEQS